MLQSVGMGAGVKMEVTMEVTVKVKVKGDVAIEISLVAVGVFLIVCLSLITWMFRTGYRLKS